MPTINQLIRKGRRKPRKEGQDACPSGRAPEEGGMCAGLYLDAQETQFGLAKGREGEA